MTRTRTLAASALALAGMAAVPFAFTASEPAVAASSSAPTWAIQPGGELAFAIANDGRDISGGFAKWGGTINFNADAPGDAAIKIEIDLVSASVGDDFNDSLLQGDEFFDTAVNPTATFSSTSVESLPDGRFVAHGELSLHGMSMAQDIEFRLSGSGAQRHVEGQASIDRVAYAIGMGSHGGGLDPTVGVTFAFDATRE
ncbi:hypothetical protein GRI89_06655 [Altererythrobacter salegens]|uniref:Lipid/polyisoprenoid-binding YceI-like domain-containing protein n=1 Tax=Croceibacterium salegens TaxID=1737568 RepID=A0A6I4SVZ3_9SPHN|nr:YceI family protein [Croceibacterium salegens]MXO59217.1 hypothetical protein [Croceibacterium salegens]